MTYDRGVDDVVSPYSLHMGLKITHTGEHAAEPPVRRRVTVVLRRSNGKGGHARRSEAPARRPLGNAGPVQIRRDPAEPERPAGTGDHAEVEVRSVGHDSFVEHLPCL